jgi:tetratricopeptide (TPR) repeat protein
MSLSHFTTRRPDGLIVVVLLATLASPPAVASAQIEELSTPIAGDLATRWRVNDDDPSAVIPSEAERNQDPLQFGYWLQDMLSRAEGAYESGDWKTVIKYYDALRQAVPQQIKSSQRICKAYRRLGEPEKALEHCQRALTMQGAIVQDHLAYLDALLEKPALSPVDVDEAQASLQHMREHAALNPQALPGEKVEPAAPVERAADMTPEERKADPQKWLRLKAQEALEKSAGEPAPKVSGDAMHLPTQIEILSCRLGVKIADAMLLNECTTKLRSYNAPPKLLVPFLWAQALAEQDEKRADEVLATAMQQGVPEPALVIMRQEQARIFAAQKASTFSPDRPFLPILGGVLVAATLAAFAWSMRRGRGAPPSPT